MGYLTVHRKGFYIHRNGKRIYIPPTTYRIKDRGKKGRGKNPIGKVDEGKLKKYGYRLKYKEAIRHRALTRSVHAVGYKKTLHRLIPLVVWFKRTNPTYSKRAKKDIKWLVERFGKR